jgi:hypothetical protein
MESLEIAGRTFQVVEDTTFAQDIYMMDRVSRAKIDAIPRDTTATTAELTEAGKEIILKAYRSGVLFELLAGMLIGAGEKWSPEVAMQNAAFFASVTDMESKKIMQGSLVGMILGFFLNADELTGTSRKSSSKKRGSKEPTLPQKEAPSTSETTT